jgi:hypothetical protein
MKNFLIAVAVLALIGSTAYGGWYVGPVGYRYYAAAPVYGYAAPVAVPAPQVVYSPVVTPAPQVVYSPVVTQPVAVAAPVVVGRPVVVGPAGKVYVVGRPVRNAVRAVLP